MYLVFCRSPNGLRNVSIGQEIEDMLGQLRDVCPEHMHQFWYWDDVWRFAMNLRTPETVVLAMNWWGSNEDLTWFKLAQDNIVMSMVDLHHNSSWEEIRVREHRIRMWGQKQQELIAQGAGFTGYLRDQIDDLERIMTREGNILADLLTKFMANHVDINLDD